MLTKDIITKSSAIAGTERDALRQGALCTCICPCPSGFLPHRLFNFCEMGSEKHNVLCNRVRTANGRSSTSDRGR